MRDSSEMTYHLHIGSQTPSQGRSGSMTLFFQTSMSDTISPQTRLHSQKAEAFFQHHSTVMLIIQAQLKRLNHSGCNTIFNKAQLVNTNWRFYRAHDNEPFCIQIGFFIILKMCSTFPFSTLCRFARFSRSLNGLCQIFLCVKFWHWRM